jgi:putative DNA primase/helicase
LGNGSNGKSLFLEMMRELIGEDNCSSLALEDLGDKFRSSEIVGKMLNIGDDSGHGLLENTAIFKKLVTGDNMTFERKRQDPFKYSNTAKLIFAANSLPPTTDKSDGFFRRCIIIPFDGVFRPGEANYDPALIYKVTTDNAKSYLLNLALTGLKKLNKDEYFDETNDTKLLVATYNAANNSVILWLNDHPKKYNTLAEAYTSYVGFCTMGGYKPYNMGKFKQEYSKYKKDTE